jgi:hypothetical protein
MSKAIRIHLAKDGKTCFCGLVINKQLQIASKGENFFELDNKPIRFNGICKNCGSLFAKNPIYRNYLEKVKYNESIVEIQDKLPKTIRSMRYYCSKRRLNWNSKNTKPIDKLSTLQAKPNTEIETIPIDSEIVLNKYVNTGNQTEKELNITNKTDEIIELTEVVNKPIEKTDKGKMRELRKQGLLPNSLNWKQIPEAIDRIEDGHPIAIVKGFNNSWKVIEEFTGINNSNNSCVKELTGWVPIELARKIYNQAIINRIF